MKKTLGIVLLVAGLIIGIIGFAQQKEDNKIIDLGKVEIKKETTAKNMNVMLIAGAVAVVGGIAVLALGGKE